MDTLAQTTPTISDIKYFRVTSRPPDEIIAQNHIQDIFTNVLKRDSPVVAEMGSGLYQEWGQYAKGVNPKARIVSIDPTLAISPDNSNQIFPYGVNNVGMIPHYDKTGKLDSVEYTIGHTDSKLNAPTEVAQRIQNERLASARRMGGTAGVAPNSVIGKKSADLVVDSFGPATYLDPKNRDKYLNSIVETLKPRDGIASIFPIDSYTHFIRNPDDTKRNEAAIEQVRSALANRTDITIEFFTTQVGNHTRPGIIIRIK